MSNYNVDTLENKIVVEAQEAIKSLQAIIGYVNQSKTAIDTMKNATGLKALDNQAKKTTSSLTKMQLISKNLKSALNFSGLIYGAKKLFSFLTSSVEKSIDYIETLNLFEVSMGKTLDQYGNLDSVSSKYYTKALKFQNELNEAFGTNIEETMRYQALYNQMAESMGINDNASYVISENLTKLGIDLASLFNATEEDTMEALRAGVLAGQTKPLRNYGLDVTQQTLAPLASELGITRSVKQLSQAEKMILRYIAVLKQASNAHGDFAKTIESPANQLKVFKQQLAELKTAIGNLFQGMLGQILPWANGILMVIKELIKAVATLFGFEVTSASTNLVDQTAIEDLETGLGGAVESAKALKAQLMGFDEINNITTDTGSSGSGGSVSSTGIDSKLLDAMSEYDNLMSKVKMEATDIRDKIMDWLGFTKKINPLTGEVSWELRKGWTNLKKIWTIIKGLIGLYLAVKVVKLIGSITKLWNVLKGTTTATSSFGVGLQTLKNIFTTTTAGAGKHAEAVTTLNMTAVKATAGIAGLAVSLYGSYDAMRDLNEGTKSADEAFVQLGISTGGAIASGALIGSVFGPVGAIIGGMAGGVISLATAFLTYKTEADKAIEATEEFNQSIQDSASQWENSQLTIANSAKEFETEASMLEKLKLSLEDCVDENGNLKESYEDRAEYILNELNDALGTEFELTDILVGKYDDIIKKIDELIETRRLASITEYFEENYKEAMDLLPDSIKKAEKAQENLNDAIEMMKADEFADEIQELYKEWNNLTDAEREAEGSFQDYAKAVADNAFWMGHSGEYDNLMGKTTKSVIENLSKQDEAFRTSSKTLEEQQNAVDKYNEAIILSQEERTQELLLLYDEELYAVENASEKIKGVYQDRISGIGKEIERQKEILENGTETQKQSAELEIALQEQKLDTIKTKLHEQALLIEEITPEMAKDWKALAKESHEKYVEGLKGLDSDTQKEIQKATGVIVNELGVATPKIRTKAQGIRSILQEKLGTNFSLSPIVTLKPSVSINTTGATTAISTFNSGITAYLEDRQKGFASLSYMNKKIFPAFATGGFPDMGEIFMAREAGPELVGRIGSRTAVANNSQIVEAVSNGVYTAVSEAMSVSNNNGSMRISGKLNGKELIQFTIDGINGMKQQTGECPIEVM